MERTTVDRLRCLDPRCRRPFAVVYHRSPTEAPISLALACPHCGTRHAIFVPAGSLGTEAAAYVFPLANGCSVSA